MSTKQRLLFITTGGTIASVRTQQGLKPVLTSEELLAHLPELNLSLIHISEPTRP